MADVYDRLLVYRRARRAFALKTFILASVFVILAALQWIPVLLFTKLKFFLLEHYYISFIVFFCALLTVTVFIFFERVRFVKPLNWILTIFIVECVVWGLARAIVETRMSLFGISFIVVTVVVVVMLIIGACLPHDLTLDVVLLFVGSIILFLGAIFFVMLHIIADVPFAVYFYLTFVVIMVLMFLMYHSQTIMGGRYAEMRIVDYLLAALIIFHDFVILFVLTFYIASRIETDTDEQYFVGDVYNTTTVEPADT